MRAFIVHNPVAGTHRAVEVRATIREQLAGAGWETIMYETSPSDDLPAIVREALPQGYDAVIAAGGDGTVSDVATGLEGLDVPLAIVPVGTGNGLARALGIPLELEEALALVTGDHPQVTSVDGLRVRGKLFMLNVGAGMSSNVVKGAGRSDKDRMGRAAYVWAGLKEALNPPTIRFRIRLDGKEEEIEASELIVTNRSSLGNELISWGMDVKPDDGRAILCVLRASSPGDFIALTRSVLTHRTRQSELVECRELTQEVQILSPHDLQVQGDGDLIGRTPVTIQLVPGVASVFVPSG